MPSWIKKSLIGLFGASLLVGGLTACSGGHHHRHGPMDAERMAEVRGKVMERVGSKLDLNEAQKQKLATLADKLQAQRAALRGQGG
jgi:protein CpxP